MQTEAKEKLLNDYNKLNYPKETTAIKYRYTYNNINVNIFFDAFDSENLNLSLVLVYERSYYYTSLNIHTTNRIKEYLFEIPSEILERILDKNNELNVFFVDIENHILSNSPNFINYEKDIIFSNTIRYCKKSKRTDLPFLMGIRRVKMSENMFNLLKETMGIKIETLIQLQKNNITLVRTRDPNKRKKLTIILKNILT